MLWSDPRVFAANSEDRANAMMFEVTAHALHLAQRRSFDSPLDLLDRILDEVYDYARKITGEPKLKETFALNALVPVDNAAWVAYARTHAVTDFDRLIPDDCRPALSHRHKRVASIPIASYGMPLEEVCKLVTDDGYFFLKLKLGSPGTQEEMLRQDKVRIEEIHRAIGDRHAPYTEDGRLPYYFDMNGRYESKRLLEELLDHCRAIGAFGQIRIVEEPFAEDYRVPVGDLGLTVAADESAHTVENVEERIELGYGAIALKAVAKTLSMTFAMARTAHERSVPCFCADLTVNPVLLEWNKNVAARLAPVPGFEIGLLETNGHQNYAAWEQMLGFHPQPAASWVRPRDGVFTLGDEFYASGGGIFQDSPHYLSLVGDSASPNASQ